jgi:23S rRNA (pseudouridine1915-N3)-methyltransferase
VKLVVTHVRSSRCDWADAACAEWGKRIGRYFPFEEVPIRSGTSAEEAARLSAHLPQRGRLVVLDERGTSLTSESFAGLIDGAAREGATHLVYAIGGAYGHAPEVRARAWKVVRLSDLVYAHAVARVVLLEQVYRACTIRAGEPYHHAG